jgi:ankyrin repeat protein
LHRGTTLAVAGTALVVGGAVAWWLLSRRGRGAASAQSLELAATLIRALQEGDSVLVDKLLRDGAAANALVDQQTPLGAAVQVGNVRAIELLLARKADPNVLLHGTTPLIEAATKNQADIVRTLLGGGADPLLPDGAGFTAAHMAAKLGNVAALAELAAASPAAIHAARDSDCATPLMLAAADNQLATVQWLIEAGADANRAMRSGVTALMSAANADHFEVVEALCGAGVALEAVESHGRTALGVAAQHGRIRASEVLLLCGASPHGALAPAAAPLPLSSEREPAAHGTQQQQQQQQQQLRPLRDAPPIALAARRGHRDVLRLLADHGADVNAELGDGRSLLLTMVDGAPRAGGDSDTSVSGPSASGAGSATADAAAISEAASGTGSGGGGGGVRVRYGVVALLLQLGADPHRLSSEAAPAAAGYGSSSADATGQPPLLRRTPLAAARASGDPKLARLFDEHVRVLGGEP